MPRNDAPLEGDFAEDETPSTAKLVPDTASSSTDDAPSATIAATADSKDARENTLLVVGRESPTSFEVTVDGEISADGNGETATVSGSSLEGTIDDGAVRFRFTGDLTDVTFVDRGITGLSPAAAPNVHVDYAPPE